jgi:hypothetical protein
MQSGSTYYRLVMNDTVRSELSPYPLRISQLPALDRAWVESVNPFSVGMPVTAPFGTYDLPNNTSETYHLGFTNQGNLFDHYIAKTETTKIILSQYSAADTIIKRFRVDTLLPASGDEYKFPLIVYTLQKDGVIFMDTIWIKTVQP